MVSDFKSIVFSRFGNKGINLDNCNYEIGKIEERLNGEKIDLHAAIGELQQVVRDKVKKHLDFEDIDYRELEDYIRKGIRRY